MFESVHNILPPVDHQTVVNKVSLGTPLSDELSTFNCGLSLGSSMGYSLFGDR